MASGLITTYLGYGLMADRPSPPDIPTGAIAFYFATDETELSCYANGAWIEDVSGTGGGMIGSNNLSELTDSSVALSTLGLSANGKSLVTAADYAAMKVLLAYGTIAAFDEATAAQVQAGTASKAVSAEKLMASAAPQTLTDGSTIAWDMAAGYNAKVTITASRTLDTPTNPKVGQVYCLAVIQDGTGGWTMTWPAAFDWGAAGAPTLTTTASKRDRITLFCTDAATPKFDAFLSGKGFS